MAYWIGKTLQDFRGIALKNGAIESTYGTLKHEMNGGDNAGYERHPHHDLLLGGLMGGGKQLLF